MRGKKTEKINPHFSPNNLSQFAEGSVMWSRIAIPDRGRNIFCPHVEIQRGAFFHSNRKGKKMKPEWKLSVESFLLSIFVIFSSLFSLVLFIILLHSLSNILLAYLIAYPLYYLKQQNLYSVDQDNYCTCWGINHNTTRLNQNKSSNWF